MSNARTTENHTKRTATAYLVTFSPDPVKGGLGHTSLYVEGPDGSSFQRSYFPSSRYYQNLLHNIAMGLFPVLGFNTKGLTSDVRYEGAPPTSVQKIENLDFDAMEKENQEFHSNIQSGNHFFSLRYNGIVNPIHALLRMVNEHQDIHALQTGGFDPIITDYPSSDDLYISTPREGKKNMSLGNCSDAAHRALEAGGFELKQSTTNRILSTFLAHGHTPARYKEDIELSGGIEMLHTPEKLPQPIQEAIAKGNEIYSARNITQESIDEDVEAVIRRMEFRM